MTKCSKHQNYVGLRKPKSSSKNPNGCSVCWDIYREKQRALHEPEKKPRRKPSTTTKRVTPKANAAAAKGLSYVRDDLSGEYEVFIDGRCFFVVSDLDTVDAVVAAFTEGMRYAAGK